MVAPDNSPNTVTLRLSNLINACARIGFINTLLYIFKTKIIRRMYSAKRSKHERYKIGTLSSNELRAPLVFRYNSSDPNVFSQIFITDEYRPLTDLRDVKSIVDCGAYVGFSSTYFLSRFPEAHVLAVEPDPRNYHLLKQNLSPYRERVTTINAAVWSRRVGLKLRSGHPGEETEWVTTVRECRQGEHADLQAVDMEKLLQLNNHDEIDILKMDIEGAEAVVFSENFEPWIKKVRAFAIELHDEECSNAFYRALASGTFRFSRSGEIAIARRHGC